MAGKKKNMQAGDGKKEIYLEWPIVMSLLRCIIHIYTCRMRGGYSSTFNVSLASSPRVSDPSMYNLYHVVLMHTHGLAHGIIQGCI